MNNYVVQPGDEIELHKDIISKCSIGILEIGILDGDTSKALASTTQLPYYGIDPIISHPELPQYKGHIDKIKTNTKDLSNFTFIHDYSYNVVKAWNKSLDYIFIDGSHYYEDVKKDYTDWISKLEPCGFISFHDSTMFRGGPNWWEGSSKFVDELIITEVNKTLKYITSVFSLTVFQKI